MASVSKSFTALGVSPSLLVKHGDQFSYSVSGTFDGTVIIEKTVDGVSFEPIVVASAADSGTLLVENKSAPSTASFRVRCADYNSGTIDTSIADVATVLNQIIDSDGNVVLSIEEDKVATLVRKAQSRFVPAAVYGKAGATAGWVVGAADNLALATCPASKTASTLVIPLSNLKVGETITGFHLVGQIESAGNTVTLDANLRVMTAAAADVVDASVASMTQLSVIADTAVTSSNAAKSSLSQVVAADQSYYLLVTATTGASTDIALQGVGITVSEV